MITPGLWRRALRRGASWRLLVLWLVGVALPVGLALGPVRLALHDALDRSPRAPQLVAALDGEAFVDLLHFLLTAERARAYGVAVALAAALALLLAPLLAAATVAVARAAEPPRWHQMLRGAGESYGKMFRVQLVSAIPYGAALGLGAWALSAAHGRSERVFTEAAALGGYTVALLVAAVLTFLAHASVDLARATIAAQPDRRSAFFAWLGAVRLLLRRPLRVLGLCLAASAAAFLLAWAFTALRLRLEQGSAFKVVLAFLLAQAAVAALGWGRASRVIGLTELVRADAAERTRPRATPVPAPAAVVPAVSSPPP